MFFKWTYPDYLPPSILFASCQCPSVSKTDNLCKIVPIHLDPSFISHFQTYSQMHRHTNSHSSSPKHTTSLHQIPTMYPLPNQIYATPVLPTSWPKMHPNVLPLWLLQVNPLTYMAMNHYLKTCQYKYRNE